MENSFKTHDIEMMFIKIMGKLDKIEKQLEESSYPSEETFRLDFVERVKTAQKEMSKGNYLNFKSMDDFLRSVEE
jgi:hypothetical protein